MYINNLMVPAGPDIYYGHGFHVVLEDHMSFLKEHPTSRVLTLEPMLAYKFEGDLFGLLLELNIPMQLHWIVMRMNNYRAPYDFDKGTGFLIVPDESTVDMIRQSHMSTRKLN